MPPTPRSTVGGTSSFGIIAIVTVLPGTRSAAAQPRLGIDGAPAGGGTARQTYEFECHVQCALDAAHDSYRPPQLTPRGSRQNPKSNSEDHYVRGAGDGSPVPHTRSPATATAVAAAGRATSVSFALQRNVSGNGAYMSSTASATHILHRKLPLHFSSDDVVVALSLKQHTDVQWSDALVLSGTAMRATTSEWERLTDATHHQNGGGIKWKHMHSKRFPIRCALTDGVGRNGGDEAAGSDEAPWTVVVHVFLHQVAASQRHRHHHANDLLDVSRSPSNVSVNDSVCSSMSSRSNYSLPGGLSSRGADGGGDLGPTISIAFWEEVLSLQQRYLHQAFYRPSIELLEREFDAAVDELVTVETEMGNQLRDRDALITSLQHDAAKTSGEPCGSPRAKSQQQHHHTPKQRGEEEVAGASPETTNNFGSMMKQKDTEISMLRARVAAMEAARHAELKGYRDEVAHLKQARQATIKATVQKAVAARRLLGASRGADGNPSRRITNADSKLGHGCTRPRSAQRSTSSAITGTSQRASPRASSNSRSRPRQGSSDRGCGAGSQPQSQQARGGSSARRDGGNDATLPSGAPGVAGSGHRHLDPTPTDREDRMRKLEESYRQLQMRHAAARESVEGLGAGSALAADVLRRVTASAAAADPSPSHRQPSQGQQDHRSSFERRTVSPLRVPAKVPGLKLTEEQIEQATEQSNRTAAATASSLAGSSPMRRGMHTGAAPPPPAPKHSLLRTSPLRMVQRL